MIWLLPEMFTVTLYNDNHLKVLKHYSGNLKSNEADKKKTGAEKQEGMGQPSPVSRYRMP